MLWKNPFSSHEDFNVFLPFFTNNLKTWNQVLSLIIKQHEIEAPWVFPVCDH